MDIKTSADMSRLARVATQNNALQTANTLATAAYKDPSTLSTAFDLFDHSLEGKIGSNPNLSADDAGTIREKFGYDAKKQMVSAAVHGVIANGGDWHHIADDPRYAPYINAPEAQQFDKVEKFYQRGAAVAQKQEMLLNKQIATANMHASLNDSWSRNVKIDPTTGHVAIDPQFVRDMVDLPTKNSNAPEAAQTAKTYIDWTESQQKPPAVHDDPMAAGLLLNVVSNPAASADDAKIAILKAEIAKQITPQTGAQMRALSTDMRQLNDPLLSRDLEAAKSIVEPKYGGVSSNPGGYAKFYYDFIHNQYMPAKVAGTLPPNALDINDPKSMISQALTKATGGINATLPAGIAGNGGIGAPVPVHTAPAKPVALPPLNEREVNHTYPTPRGPMTWTGKGWIAPQADTGPRS
jgi:hypothetical protein